MKHQKGSFFPPYTCHLNLESLLLKFQSLGFIPAQLSSFTHHNHILKAILLSGKEESQLFVKKMKDQQNMLKMMSLKHLLVISLALNVGLISRVLFVGDKSEEFYCFENKEALGMEVSREEKHVEKKAKDDAGSKTVSYSSFLPTGTAAAAAQDDGSIINLDHGDPTMYERYWQQMGDKTTTVISGWQLISYFSDIRNICWFLESAFANAIVRLHKQVGNAVTEGRHIVVGTGSTQLYQAVLYALCPENASEPMSVVSAAPFYSSYPLMTDFLKSGLYKWAGDAYKFSKDEPYIELVTSPNNPDGSSRVAVVNRKRGILVHDLAYYWPQYTPISFPADHDIMLFTFSKSTGHAGTRLGWALVKDEEIAKRMTKYIELNTIGVSKDSQIRAAKILHHVADSIEHSPESKRSDNFFEFGYNLMALRWAQLRAAVNISDLFSLPSFPSGTCRFSGHQFKPQPAFAWLKCERDIEDCESFLRSHNILTRGGKHFGVGPEYVRISMMARDEIFDRFTQRLSMISS